MKKIFLAVVVSWAFVVANLKADRLDDMYDQVEGLYKEIRGEYEEFEDSYTDAAEIMAKSFTLYHAYYKQVFGLYDRFMIRFRGYKPDSISGWNLDDVLVYHKINDESLSSMEKFSEYSRKLLIDLKSISVLLEDITEKLEAAIEKEGRGGFKHHHGKRQGGRSGGHGRKAVKAMPTYSTSFFGKIEDVGED